MKKKLSFILAALLVLSLFAACSGSTPAPSGSASQPTAAPTSAASGSTQEPTQPEESSDYNFAAGKYEVGPDGIATELYEYTLPLSTTDEVFTFWSTCYTPEYIVEDSYAEMPFQAELRDKTGVNIEYILIDSSLRSENLSVLLASNDLPDMMQHGAFYYGKGLKNAIEENWFANLYDYKEYMPNYLYRVKSCDNFTVTSTVYNTKDTIGWFYGLTSTPLPVQSYCVRKDWIDTLGIDASKVITYDHIYDMLTRFKNELDVQWPMEVFSSIELVPTTIGAGYNTSIVVGSTAMPSLKLNDNGNLTFTLVNQEDRDLMEMLSKWYSEGLIDVNYGSYIGNADMETMVATGATGFIPLNPGQLSDFENLAGTEFVAVSRPLLTEGQILEYGQKNSNLYYGTVSLSATCENLPLAVTYWDYPYSPEGSDYFNWGVEGITWEYNENGERMQTEFITNNPTGFSGAWLNQIYKGGSLIDAFWQTPESSYAYDGGERVLEMYMSWIPEEYSGKYDLPGTITLTDEESAMVTQYSGDIGTFISENYLSFFEGSKPLSEWDAYIQRLEEIGINQVLEIYEGAYQRLLEQMKEFGFSA